MVVMEVNGELSTVTQSSGVSTQIRGAVRRSGRQHGLQVGILLHCIEVNATTNLAHRHRALVRARGPVKIQRHDSSSDSDRHGSHLQRVDLQVGQRVAKSLLGAHV